jgi:hypothetical protein
VHLIAVFLLGIISLFDCWSTVCFTHFIVCYFTRMCFNVFKLHRLSRLIIVCNHFTLFVLRISHFSLMCLWSLLLLLFLHCCLTQLIMKSFLDSWSISLCLCTLLKAINLLIKIQQCPFVKPDRVQ